MDNVFDISIIIPTWNVSEKNVNGKLALNLGIKSVKNQLCDNFSLEVIFVDDASTDSTINILSDLKKKNKELNIKIIKKEKNSGSPASGRNIGIANAQGKYIMFMDNDDQLGDKGSLNDLFNKIEKWKSDLIIGKAVPTGPRGIGSSFLNKGNQKRANLFEINPLASIAVWSRLYSAEFLRKINAHFPEGNNIGEDYYFNALIYSKTNKVSIATDYTYYWWVDADEGHLSDYWNDNYYNLYIEQFITSLSFFEHAEDNWQLQNLAAFTERIFANLEDRKSPIDQLFQSDYRNRESYIKNKNLFLKLKKQLLLLNKKFINYLPWKIELKIRAILNFDFMDIIGIIHAIDNYMDITVYSKLSVSSGMLTIFDELNKKNKILGEVLADCSFESKNVTTLSSLNEVLDNEKYSVVFLSRNREYRVDYVDKNTNPVDRIKFLAHYESTFDLFLLKKTEGGEAGIMMPYHSFYKDLFELNDDRYKMKIYKNWKGNISLNIVRRKTTI